jgi:hypothetical protein
MKSMILKWWGHVTWMGRREMRTGLCCGKVKEGNNLEDLDVDGYMVMKCILSMMERNGLD